MPELAKGVRGPSLPVLMQMPDPVSVTWNCIAVPGAWKGHVAGEFEMNTPIFEQIIKNFRSDPFGRVHVDMEHLSETLGSNVAVTGAPAHAWITDLAIRDGQLWGKWEWVNKATVDMIRAGQIFSLSPAVNFNAIDGVSGENIGARLSSVALTNAPFLRSIPPVMASQTLSLSPDSLHLPQSVGIKGKPAMDEAEAAEMGMYKKVMSRLKKAMSMGDVTDPDAVAEAVESLVKKGMEMSAREMKRESDDADIKVAARVDGGVIADTVEARTAAKKICMSDHATFELLFPIKEKPATKPAPGVQPTAAEAALLSTRIMPAAPAQTAPSAPQAVDYNDQLFILAEQIADEIKLKEPKLDVTTLLMRATSEAKQRLGQKALAGLVR